MSKIMTDEEIAQKIVDSNFNDLIEHAKLLYLPFSYLVSLKNGIQKELRLFGLE